MTKKQKVRGIAKAEQLHKRRSESAKRSDLSKRAKSIRPTKKGIKKWKKKQKYYEKVLIAAGKIKESSKN